MSIYVICNYIGYKLPWESNDWIYPTNFASALEIAVEASNGASDYGNKFGEPVLAGFSRSFGMLLPNMERREWIKPIMFSGGIGSIDERHVMKKPSEIGWLYTIFTTMQLLAVLCACKHCLFLFIIQNSLPLKFLFKRNNIPEISLFSWNTLHFSALFVILVNYCEHCFMF